MVETLDPGAGDNTIKHPLAAVIGFDATTVHAQATAEWGAPVAGETLNLAIAECEFDRATPQEGAETPIKMVISWHENQQKNCPGTNPEGGFGGSSAPIARRHTTSRLPASSGYRGRPASMRNAISSTTSTRQF